MAYTHVHCDWCVSFSPPSRCGPDRGYKNRRKEGLQLEDTCRRSCGLRTAAVRSDAVYHGVGS